MLRVDFPPSPPNNRYHSRPQEPGTVRPWLGLRASAPRPTAPQSAAPRSALVFLRL